MAGIPILAMTFWLVVFGISALGIWSQISRERERQQTIRAAIERGQQLDPAVLEKVMARPDWNGKEDKRRADISHWQQLLVAGIITLFVGPGLALLGVFIGKIERDAYWPLLGCGALVSTIGLGLLIAALVWRRLVEGDTVKSL